MFFGVSKDLSHYIFSFFLMFQASSYIHFIFLIVRGSVDVFAYLFYAARFEESILFFNRSYRLI